MPDEPARTEQSSVPLIDPQAYAAARPALMKLADQQDAWRNTREAILRFVATSRSFDQLLAGLNLFLLGISMGK